MFAVIAAKAHSVAALLYGDIYCSICVYVNVKVIGTAKIAAIIKCLSKDHVKDQTVLKDVYMYDWRNQGEVSNRQRKNTLTVKHSSCSIMLCAIYAVSSTRALLKDERLMTKTDLLLSLT